MSTQTIQPIPEDLIDRWECYHFMFAWENSQNDYQATFIGQHNFAKTLSLSPQSLRVLQTKMSGVSSASLADCHQFVVDFPEFVRILQTRCLLQSYLSFDDLPNLLYEVRHLLGLSWDDIMPSLSTLRRIIGGGTRNQVIAGTITILAHALELYPIDISSVVSDLAVGLLHLIPRIGTRGLPLTLW
jgi:hypothetical protein